MECFYLFFRMFVATNHERYANESHEDLFSPDGDAVRVDGGSTFRTGLRPSDQRNIGTTGPDHPSQERLSPSEGSED